MTKKNALTIALTALTNMNSDESNEAIGVLTKMIEGLNARPRTDEQKAKQNEKRKAATAAARAALMEQVLPVLQRGQLPPPREHPLPVQQRLPGGPSLPLSRQPALPPWGRPAFSWPVSLQPVFSRRASFPRLFSLQAFVQKPVLLLPPLPSFYLPLSFYALSLP